MALFQPTNVIPSSFTQGTVDAVKDNMEVSWQVNGNSAMTAFQIDFYLNDADSTYITSTGRQTDNCPFYGTDRFGNPQFFTYNANRSWEEVGGFANGNNYKLKITQFYNEGGVEKSVIQTSFAAFITRSTPTLKLYTTARNYKTDKTALTNGGSLATSIGYFVADYEQDQGDPIRWIRWQVATANNGNIGDILMDTGDIYTPTLNFEFNGFFNGNQYAIRAIGDSERGQECNSNPISDGWICFTINIVSPGTYSGNFTVQCLKKENVGLLQWEGIEVISPTISPAGYQPDVSNGSVTLEKDSSLTWNTVSNSPMNFAPEFTAAIKLNTQFDFPSSTIKINGASVSNVQVTAFSPDGTLLVVGTGNNTNAKVYLFSVNNTTITYLSEITRNGVSFNFYIRSVIFSPDGNTLIVGDGLGAYSFSVNNTTITYLSEITRNGVSLGGNVDTAVFNPNGNILVLGGDFTGYASIFSVNSSITYINDITRNNVALSKSVSVANFSPDGTLLVLGGGVGTDGYAYSFSVNNTTITYLSEITRNGVSLGGDVEFLPFSPDGKLLVSCGLNGSISVFLVNGTTITFSYNIPCQNVTGATFSPDGKSFVLSTIYGVYLYAVNGTTIQGSATITLNDSGRISYSPNTNVIVVSHNLHSYQLNYSPIGEVLSISNVNIKLNSVNYYQFELLLNGSKYPFSVYNTPTVVLIILTPNKLYVYGYKNDNRVSQSETTIFYTPQPITSISVYGGENGTTINSIAIYRGNGSNVLPLYQNNVNFEPSWNSEEYKLYMAANFNGNLEGGTGTASGVGFRVYRQEVGKNVLMPIATVSSTVTSVKDYGIMSRKAYKYLLYAYDSADAFMNAVEAQNVLATSFNNYSLLVCDYDQDKDEYHVRKQYPFALNLTDSSVGNNNNPTLNANFTPYPTRMASTQNYASGTLQGLIGAIYTVPALIEQISNYKWTAKPSTLDYFDSVDLEKELYDLSVAPYQLFLRDMKGRLRMVHTSGAISMTTNIKQRQQSISISLPWVEIGDASDVTIIQTPDDYGWNNDNQVLDVSLDVDINTGELFATYPFPYNGTKFYLTGVDKENLTTKTPLGITPAQFKLSDVASQPCDGELTATVTSNSNTTNNS